MIMSWFWCWFGWCCCCRDCWEISICAFTYSHLTIFNLPSLNLQFVDLSSWYLICFQKWHLGRLIPKPFYTYGKWLWRKLLHGTCRKSCNHGILRNKACGCYVIYVISGLAVTTVTPISSALTYITLSPSWLFHLSLHHHHCHFLNVSSHQLYHHLHPPLDLTENHTCIMLN